MLLSLLTFSHSLIAIMLGRLGMDVDECIKVYEKLMGSIFGTKAFRIRLSAPMNVNARYDSKKVKSAIEKVLSERRLSEDSDFNDKTERRYKVYVPIMMPLSNTDP